jgi:hypothetical protein
VCGTAIFFAFPTSLYWPHTRHFSFFLEAPPPTADITLERTVRLRSKFVPRQFQQWSSPYWSTRTALMTRQSAFDCLPLATAAHCHAPTVHVHRESDGLPRRCDLFEERANPLALSLQKCVASGPRTTVHVVGLDSEVHSVSLKITSREAARPHPVSRGS